ncbi:MAG TPA: hypothetical protein VNW95_17455 [Mucilaginibacter sp.]|jgi:hypothetical protein|nr:hypothetical protein [Mucilaginibacter sp.]
MIRTRFKKVLLVAPDVFPGQLLADNKNVKHIAAISGIFPSIFELNPQVIIFDYDYIGADIEKVLRRIKINRFYDKLKICCYKSTPNEKTDSLLKALGVDHLFYQDDMAKLQKNKTILGSVAAMFDASIMKWVANASH